MGQGDWASREAAAIGERVAARRHVLGLSQSALVSRCAGLGMPSVTRRVIVALEGGNRESVSTAELAVLAAALGVAPVELLYPLGAAEAEYLPGQSAVPWMAASWWSGEQALTGEGLGGWHRGPVMLFREHEAAVAGLPDGATEAAYLRTRHRQFSPEGLTEAERMLMLSVVALQDTRRRLQEEGLDPPPLPEHLKWVDA